MTESLYSTTNATVRWTFVAGGLAMIVAGSLLISAKSRPATVLGGALGGVGVFLVLLGVEPAV